MRRALLMALLGIAAAAPTTGRGGMIVRRTRENGANAIRIGSQIWTLDRWIDFRTSNPGWFAEQNPRLGQALGMGKSALIARRSLNPRRFDYYHQSLGYLLADPFTDKPALMTNLPVAPPSVFLNGPVKPPAPPDPLAPGGSGGPTPIASAVPEPPTISIIVFAFAASVLYGRAGWAWRKNRSAVRQTRDRRIVH